MNHFEIGSRDMSAEQQHIIMNFTTPPSDDDIRVIAEQAVDSLPDEISGNVETLNVVIEDIADETTATDMELDDPFELIALYRSGKHVAPGVESKIANDDDAMILYRRPLLDLWCESGDDLNILIRQVIIEELAQNFDFSDDEIEEMTERHFQGML